MDNANLQEKPDLHLDFDAKYREPKPGGNAGMKAKAMRWLGIGPLFIVLCLIIAFINPVFLSFQNWMNLLSASSAIWLMAMAMTLVLITAGFDLSIGSLMALSGIVLVSLLRTGMPQIVAIVVTLLIVTALGMFTNGWLIGKMKLNFFVVTLGTMSLFRGIVYVATNGQTLNATDYPLILFLGNGKIGPFPVPIVIMACAFLLTLLLLRYTIFGRSVYVVGGNPATAHLTGMKVSLILMLVYGISAMFAALAGVVEAGRLATASPTVGVSLELLVGAAVLLGGTSFRGGEGSVAGTALGVLFIGVLQNGLSLMGISSYWQNVITGLILIFAIMLNQAKAKKE